jgi:hypothetical protein
MVALAQDVGRPRVRAHKRRYPLGAGRSSHANKALALCDETDAGNVIGGGDRPDLRASRCVARGDVGLLRWVAAGQDDQGRNEQRSNDQRCDVERPGEGRWNGEGSHEKG